MVDSFVGEIRVFAGNFAPSGWMFCAGQLLQIAQYEALFALVGTTYGGDGITTFGLPDLRGRSAVHSGTSSFGVTYDLGQKGGAETVTLSAAQMPQHTHAAVYSATATSTSPAAARWAPQTASAYAEVTGSATLAPDAIREAGGSQPHENMPPFVAVSYIISLFGIFPTQN